MPRLAPSLVQIAYRQHRLLPFLLYECRDLSSAQNELRWLRDHAFQASFEPTKTTTTTTRVENSPILLPRKPQPTGRQTWRGVDTLMRNVLRRSRGEPLQYILGTQPFGELEILCKKNVLIPRNETAAYTTQLADLLQELQKEKDPRQEDRFRILDLCTGTGCISLLLHSLLRPVTTASASEATRPPVKLEIVGIDISDHAVTLARQNLHHNLRHGLLHASAAQDVLFRKHDLFGLAETQSTSGADLGSFDVVISNPPYISPSQYGAGGPTSRSVRKFEPKLALVPSPLMSSSSLAAASTADSAPISAPDPLSRPDDLDQGDVFYPALLRIAQYAGAKVLLMEAGDSDQARRVTGIATEAVKGQTAHIELWRDDGFVRPIAAGGARGEGETVTGSGAENKEVSDVDIIEDETEDRAVVVWMGDWAQWRRS